MKHVTLAWTILVATNDKSLDSTISTINKHSEHLNFPEVLKIVQRIFCELMLWKLYWILFRYFVSRYWSHYCWSLTENLQCGEGLIFGCLQTDTFSLFCTIFFLLLQPVHLASVSAAALGPARAKDFISTRLWSCVAQWHIEPAACHPYFTSNFQPFKIVKLLFFKILDRYSDTKSAPDFNPSERRTNFCWK